MPLRYGTESDKYTLQVITHTHVASTLKKKSYRAGALERDLTTLSVRRRRVTE